MTLKFYDDGSGNSYTAMGVPGQLSTSNVTANSADLTLPTGVTGAQYYELTESKDGGSTWTVVDSAIAPSAIVSPATYSRSGLTSGATYQWRLRAKFASLVSPLYSALAEANPIGDILLFSDNFESGDLTSSNSKFNWGVGESTAVVTTQPRNGLYSLQFTYAGNPDLSADAWSEQRFSLDRIYKEIWVRYSLLVPSNYIQRTPAAKTPDNNKGLLFLWSGQYNNNPPTLVGVNFGPYDNGSSEVDINWRTDAVSPSDSSVHYGPWNWGANMDLNPTFESSRGRPLAIDRTTDLGQWIDYVVQMKVADPNQANGVITIWKNGQLVARWKNATDRYSADSSMNGFDAGYLLGWANTGFTDTTIFYLDDFKIGTGPSSINFTVPA